jgi:hypothetical protein
MVEEQRATRRVVKKVVKKTVVVRPAQPGSTTLRTPAPPTGGTPLAKLRAKAATVPRPTFRLPSPPRRPGAGLAGRARLAGTRISDRWYDVTFAAKQSVRRGVQRVRDTRLPHLSPMRGAAITGIVTGLLSVMLGWLSYQLLSVTGNSATGGGWGALVLVVVAFLTFAAGELLLDGFGIEHGRIISATSVMLVLVLVLLFSPLLELAAGPGAWILLPVLGAIAFMVSCRVMNLAAADQPNLRP